MRTGRLSVALTIILYWLPVAVIAAGISIGSSLSGSRVDDVLEDTVDAVGGGSLNLLFFHVVEFAALSLVLYRLLWRYLRWAFPYLAIAVTLLAGAYGVADELHQRYVPGRVASLEDFGADALGTVIALLLVWAVLGLRRLIKQPAG